MKRIPQLDGLRGVAVLLVFVYHAWKVPLLWSGVDLFFVLSGYLITGILLDLKEKRATKGYARTFYLRRVRRIIPPYAGFMLFLIFFVPVPWRQVWYWYAFFAGNLATTFGHVDLRALVPLWSLGVEEQFYLLWPWIVLACSRRSLRRVALGIVIAAPILRAIFTPLIHDHEFIASLTPFRADLLAAGAWIAIVSGEDSSPQKSWVQRHRQSSLFAFWGGLILLAGLSARHSFRQTANSYSFNILGYSLIVLTFAAALVQCLAMRDGFVYRLLTSRPLRFMGMISYTFYLYQVPLLDIAARHMHSRTLSILLAFVVTGIVATLSWYLIESPILHWGGKGKTKQRDPVLTGTA
jgi:peptidoglycan/LPS O-acetylase OafA/YrhL